MAAVLTILAFMIIVGLGVSQSTVHHNEKLSPNGNKCIDTSINILTKTGVKIEPYNKSYVALYFNKKARSLQKSFKIEFSFKTTHPDGILFYTRNNGNPADKMALYLEGGQLRFKHHKCATIAVLNLKKTKTNQTLDDGQWHTLGLEAQFMRRYDPSIPAVMYKSRSKNVLCRRVTSLVMGGSMAKDLKHMKYIKNLSGHFDGCIRNLTLRLPLKSSSPLYSAISICD